MLGNHLTMNLILKASSALFSGSKSNGFTQCTAQFLVLSILIAAVTLLLIKSD